MYIISNISINIYVAANITEIVITFHKVAQVHKPC